MIDAPENANRQFKCPQCGTLFAVKNETASCPVCGNTCSAQTCQVLDASDEGY